MNILTLLLCISLIGTTQSRSEQLFPRVVQRVALDGIRLPCSFDSIGKAMEFANTLRRTKTTKAALALWQNTFLKHEELKAVPHVLSSRLLLGRASTGIVLPGLHMTLRPNLGGKLTSTLSEEDVQFLSAFLRRLEKIAHVDSLQAVQISCLYYFGGAGSNDSGRYILSIELFTRVAGKLQSFEFHGVFADKGETGRSILKNAPRLRIREEDLGYDDINDSLAGIFLYTGDRPAHESELDEL